jgi:hypothetical protein
MAKKRPRQRGREKRTFWLQASSLHWTGAQYIGRSTALQI